MTALTCGQPGCEFETSGKCIEGFTPAEKCPFLAARPEEIEDVPTEADPVMEELVDLPSGEALTETQAGDVTRSDATRVVIVAGPLGSGKTTILTSLYEAFLHAPFANFLFKGSRTLVGFERRSHQGREESGSQFPRTTRTSVNEGVVFLHLDLAIRDEGGGLRSSNLLLSDISGELFRILRDSSQAVTEMSSLRRADNLAIVIDGQKLTRADQRQTAKNDSRSILRSIVEAGVLKNDCVIDIVFTKWDIVATAVSSSDRQEINSFIDGTKESLAKTVAGYRVVFHEVAARPTAPALPFAHGVPTLLRSWMDSEVSESKPSIFTFEKPMRELERYINTQVDACRIPGEYNVHKL